MLSLLSFFSLVVVGDVVVAVALAVAASVAEAIGSVFLLLLSW